MALAKEALLEFDGLAIDFAGRRLLRDGQPLALERKAFDVLALLAGSPGTAFTREQILDAVWGHRHVTPGVLNRVMTLLRHALGEEANAPRYLHTLHGVGYRFDLPAGVAAPVVPEAAADPEPPALPRIHVSPPVPLAPPRRAVGWGLAASLLVLLAFIGFGAWWVQGERVHRLPAPTPPRTPTLIVMPLKPIGGGSANPIAAGLSEELISELARIDGLRVIAHESTTLAAEEGTPLAQLVPKLGITHALEGSLRQAGEALRVNLRLTEVASGRALWSQDFDRDAADALVLQREIAQAVATSLTLRLALAPAQRGGDAQFLRRYFAAHALTGLVPRSQGARADRAEAEFRALVRERPDDARVHAGLAVALETRAFQHHELSVPLREEAAREAAIALALDPRQFEAQGVQAAAACRAQDWERCIGTYERALAAAPSNSPMRYQYTMALASLGYLDRAEAQARAGVARDPLNSFWHFALGRILDTRGRHDAARIELEATSPKTLPYGRWFNAVWRGDLDAAAAIAAQLPAFDNDVEHEEILWNSYVLATAALADPRRWPEARAEMEKWEVRSGLMNFLHVLAPGADPAKLLAGLAETRRRSYSSWDLLVWTRDLRYLRTAPAFQAYLEENGILDYWKQHGYPSQCTPQATGVDCL